MKNCIAVAMIGMDTQLMMKVAYRFAGHGGHVLSFENWSQTKVISDISYVIFDKMVALKDIQAAVSKPNFIKVIWVDDKVMDLSERSDCCPAEKMRLQIYQMLSDIRIIGTMSSDDLDQAVKRINQTLSAYQDYIYHAVYDDKVVV